MNNIVVQNILKDLEGAQIIRKKAGLYELKHDSLAPKIAQRRTETQQKLNRFYNIIKQNSDGGTLTKAQLKQIVPYRKMLKSNYVNQQEETALEAFIDSCINKYKAQRTKLIAIVISISIIVLSCSLYINQIKKLERLSKSALTNIENNDFDSAYMQIKEIKESQYELIKSTLSKNFNSTIEELYKTLLFNTTADNIKFGGNYILVYKKPYVTIKTLTGTSNTYYSTKLDSVSGKNPPPVFSMNKDCFSMIKLQSDNTPDARSLITLNPIDVSNKKYNPIGIEMTDRPTADFDSLGNLYYYKGNEVWCYDYSLRRPVSFAKDPSSIIKQPDSKVLITFLKRYDQTPSDFLNLAINDSNFIFNIKDKRLILKTGPRIGQDLSSNRYLIYSEKTADSIKFYQADLNSTSGIRMPLGSRKITNDLNMEQEFNSVVSKNKKSLIIFTERKSPDSNYAVSSGSARTYLEIKHLKNTTRIQLDTTIQKLYTYEARNDMFIYVYGDKEKYEYVSFNSYDLKNKKLFNVPHGWNFARFVDNKFMIFSRPVSKNMSMQALLIIDPHILDDDYLQKWFQN